MSDERPRAVVICSGGMDSTALAWDVYADDYYVHLVSFDYGQRHRKELQYAAKTAERMRTRHEVIDLRNLSLFLAESGSSLVSDAAVPEGHYAEDNMKQTVVPNRNMIMLSIAGGIAVATGAKAVYTGVHAGDHFIYPDCRPEFIDLASRALTVGNEGFANFDELAIKAPWLHSTKADIALNLLEMQIPFSETWSCYKGGDIHCGKCGTCVERLEAIDEAQQRYKNIYRTDAPVDDTEYEDKEYWREVVSARSA